MKKPYVRRKGITAVLAMLFLVLFSTLALAFYSTTTTAVALAKNDVKNSRALRAAESGVQFMRYHLAHTRIQPDTADAEVLTTLRNDLKAQLEGMLQMSGKTVEISGNTILVPSQPGAFIVTDDGDTLDPNDDSGFRAILTKNGDRGNVVCTVTGVNGNTTSSHTRSVKLDFKRLPVETNLYDHAVASRGQVVMQKGNLTGVPGFSDPDIADIMSARPPAQGAGVIMVGGSIGGDVGVMTSKTNALISGGSIHGTSNLSTIYNTEGKYLLAWDAPPDFPIIDTSVFKQYATTPYSSTAKTHKNVLVPANSGTISNPLKFAGNDEIQGILFIESPNVIEFRGTVTLSGFIVLDGVGTTTSNQIDVSGNFKVGTLPDKPEFNEIRTVEGIGILAPTTAMRFSGANQSEMRGNMIVGTFRNAGSADLLVDQGTIVTMQESSNSAVFNGANVKFKSTGVNNQPSAGVSYSEQYVPAPGSYKELN
jgi:Tfp pilus assembly protein PilX